TWTLGRHTAVLVSFGRYPTDAVTGSIAGRYITAALRLGAVSPRTPAPRTLSIDVPAGGASDDASTGDRARLEVQVHRGDEASVTLYAPGAAVIEISGDFTDWRPVQLSRQAAGSDVWVGTFRISSGVHRINLRRVGDDSDAPQEEQGKQQQQRRSVQQADSERTASRHRHRNAGHDRASPAVSVLAAQPASDRAAADDRERNERGEPGDIGVRA